MIWIKKKCLYSHEPLIFSPGFCRQPTISPAPIGNLTSQFWANCYLNPFDHFVKRELRCKGYVRYVDDCVLFARDKKTLWAWKAALERRLEDLRFKLHPGAHPRPVEEGIPFLGFTVYPERRRLKRRKGIYFQRKFCRLAAKFVTSQKVEEEFYCLFV